MERIDNYIKEIPLYDSLYGKKLKNFTFGRNLNEYPLLEREHIIDGFPNNWMTPLLQNAINNDSIETTTTSGTSGQRIQIFRKKGWWKDEYIRTYRHSSYLKDFHVGVTRKAILTTAICSNATCYLDFPSYEDRIISNTLYLNLSGDPNSWSKSEVLRMMSELNEFQPEYLDADPIYLALFLKKIDEFCGDHVFHLPSVVTLSYELVTAYARRFIQSHLNTPLLNLYGTTELGYIYIENEGKLTHCSDLSHVEFVPFSEKKGIYYLILSSFKNEYMPFVRFKIGDLVKINSSLEFNALSEQAEIEYFCGREKDVVFNNKDEPVSPGEIDHSLSQLQNNVLIYQIQLKNKNILFRYISFDSNPLSENIKNEIKESLIGLFGEGCEIQFKLERSISPDASGKFSTVKRI